MTIKFSDTVRNALGDAYETSIGTAPLLRIYTGSAPAAVTTAASGTLLVEIALPSDWLTASSGGVKSKSGTWSAAASAGGTAGYYRIYNTAGSTCHEQGTITSTGGGGDMEIDNTTIASAQQVVVNTFTRTAPSA